MRPSASARALLTAAALAAAAPPLSADDAPVRGPTVEARLAEIQRLVQRALVYPPIARRRGVEGETLVAFEVGADGAAEDVEIARSSGYASLDRAAKRAVGEAGRLPYVYGRLEIPVRFILDEAP